jgi:hypothetical protein
MKLSKYALRLALILAMYVQAQADVILDYSPDTSGAILTPQDFAGPGSTWSNYYSSQNFGELISFGSDVTITGMDIYSSFAQVGTNVLVRTWADSAGTPDSGSVMSFASVVAAVDLVGITSADPLSGYNRMFVDFGSNSFTLSANTSLWIGISGLDYGIGLVGLAGPNAPGNGKMAQFAGSTFGFHASIGDMAMRIHGTQNVPDSASMLSLLGLGALGLALMRRLGTR